MTSYVENETEAVFEFDVKKLADSVIEKVLETEGCPYDVQINLLLTDNEGIRAYNAQFRQIDRETDVLSFPNV
ncbi:MAG: rRNA maturation RNase YbeY, partial [Lachnospiraceae bacterium]